MESDGHGLVLDGVVLRRAGRPVLDGCDARFPAGAVTHLSGANGSGKTTLLKVAAGLLAPSSGTVSRPPGGVAYVPDLGATASRLPVAALQRALLADCPPGTGERLGPTLHAIGYTAPDNALPGQLSRGNRQKLLVAIAVVSGRRLVLADEPVSGVDAASRPAVLALLATAAGNGRTVVLTGHSAAEIPPGARRLRLHDGQCRPPDDDPPPTPATRTVLITARSHDSSPSPLPRSWSAAAGAPQADIALQDDGTWLVRTAATGDALRLLLDLECDILSVQPENGPQ